MNVEVWVHRSCARVSVLTKAVEFRPCVTAETLKACALISLHMIAEEATSSFLNGISGRWVEVWRFKEPFVERQRWRVDRKQVHIFLRGVH